MRTVFQVLSVLFLVLGGSAALLGLAALLYAKLAPVQPPPSLNEGAGLAGFLGFFMTLFGSVSALLGIAMLAGLRALRKPNAEQWAREHKRLW